MPYLGDFLGHLMAEITLARVQADLEAVRVAELYANHPLLKNVSIPRFRLPTLTLDVPVAVKSMEEAKPGTSPRGDINLPRLRKRFAEVVDAQMVRSELKLSDAERSALDKALDGFVAASEPQRYVSTSLTHFADDMVSSTMGVLNESIRTRPTADPGLSRKLADELKSAARQAFADLRAEPPRLMVLVTTAELREAGPSQLLTQLHLSISEEAFEWSVAESQGKTTLKLVPE